MTRREPFKYLFGSHNAHYNATIIVGSKLKILLGTVTVNTRHANFTDLA
jgi:hypothetical protein